MNPVDPAKVYRLMYPAVPAIVSCNDRGVIYAMPVVSIMSLSISPPLVGIASSPAHKTHKAIARVGSFSVCWVDQSLVTALEFLGTKGQTSPDKLKAAGLKHAGGSKLDVPIVEGAAASLECSLSTRQALGDHELLVGKVEVASASNDFQEYWRFKTYKPILYIGTQGGSLRAYRPRA